MANNNTFEYRPGTYRGTLMDGEQVVTSQRQRFNTTTNTNEVETRQYSVVENADGSLTLSRIRETLTYRGRKYAVNFVPSEE